MKTSKKLIASAAIVLAGLGVAAPVGVMTANAASAPVLKPGARSQNVSSLQLLLRAHGARLEVDGSFGPATEAAVKSFQRSHGLQADGVVGPKTLGKLGIVLKEGSKGKAVEALQQILRNQGVNVAVDGSFGPATKSAVMAFQKKKSITSDGVVGPKTWQALFGATNTPGPSEPPAPPSKPHPGDVTYNDLKAMFPDKIADKATVEKGLPSLNAEMRKRGINTAARKAAFLATVASESTFNYAIGENGYGGSSYRGRGFIQLTGSANYSAAGKYLGVDLMGSHQSRASDIRYSAPIAGWYWTVARPKSNAAADAFDMGRISAYIGYDLKHNPGEDNARCARFKKAYKHLSGQDAPATTRCARHY